MCAWSNMQILKTFADLPLAASSSRSSTGVGGLQCRRRSIQGDIRSARTAWHCTMRACHPGTHSHRSPSSSRRAAQLLCCSLCYSGMRGMRMLPWGTRGACF